MNSLMEELYNRYTKDLEQLSILLFERQDIINKKRNEAFQAHEELENHARQYVSITDIRLCNDAKKAKLRDILHRIYSNGSRVINMHNKLIGVPADWMDVFFASERKAERELIEDENSIEKILSEIKNTEELKDALRGRLAGMWSSLNRRN